MSIELWYFKRQRGQPFGIDAAADAASTAEAAAHGSKPLLTFGEAGR